MAREQASFSYLPLDTLKSVTDNVWIVDGPVIRFGYLWPKLPFPTRMTIIALEDGNLFIHSPTRLTTELRTEILQIGTPRWIVAPNRIHYWWTPDWNSAFPEAEVYLAPRIKEEAGSRIGFAYLPLDRDSGYPWDAAIATILVPGSYMTEADFFHRPSRTLVLADLIENFEPARISFAMRLLAKLSGCLDPHGGMPRDLRATFAKQKPAFRAAIETMISWNPDRVILAHGRCYERDGANELRRAFHWLLTERS